MKILLSFVASALVASGLYADGYEDKIIESVHEEAPVVASYKNIYEPLNDRHIRQNRASDLNETINFIAQQLSQNKDLVNISGTNIAVTSFLNIQKLNETNVLGNIISENLMHALQIRGFRVVDYKAMKNIFVGKKGDYALSRDKKNLPDTQDISYVLSGTYTKFKNGYNINARIIDMKTKVLLSSAQAFIDKSVLKDLLVEEDCTPKTMYVVPAVSPNYVKIEGIED
jgi:TolB-like protein